MAQQVNAGQTKRMDILGIYPEEIVVKQSENGRVYKRDVTDLVVSILREGKILQPLEVRKIEENKVQLVFGYRRHSAAAFINQHINDGTLQKLADQYGISHDRLPVEPIRIPCIVSSINAKEAYLRNIAENQDREGLSAVEKAHQIRRMEEQYGMSEDEIRAHFTINGKPASSAWVAQTKKFLALDDKLQRKFHEMELSAEIAYKLYDMPEEMRASVLEKAEESAKASGKKKPTLADVTEAAREEGALAKPSRRKMPEVVAKLEEHSAIGSIHRKRFIAAFLGWINDTVSDEDLDKEFERRFKE